MFSFYVRFKIHLILIDKQIVYYFCENFFYRLIFVTNPNNILQIVKRDSVFFTI